MYIPEFWCGALATIGVEIAFLIGYSVYLSSRGRKKK